MARRRFLSGLRSAASPEVKALMSGFTVGNLGSRGDLPVTVSRGYGGRSYGNGMGQDKAAGWDLDRVVTEAFEQNIWVYRCVELIAGSQARLPFRVARFPGSDDEEVLDTHPLYRVLNKRANPLENAYQFRKRLSQHILLSKRGAFIEVTKSRGGTISRLDLLDPARTRPMPSDSGNYLDYFEHVTLDGEVREIEPQRIRWVREPHPTDPFCGTTPLESAGMSIDLDFLARVYNVSFIRNDARPGGILGIDADKIGDQELTRIAATIKGGAHRAGEIAVVGTGPGGIDYVDTTTRPRDMAYGELSGITKTEILTAFGIDESLLGNVAGRTFDNAEQALFNFWTQPMPPHLGLITSAFEDDLEEDYEAMLDTSKIAALEVGERQRRAEAKVEFDSGLRSIDEYRPLAKLPQLNNPQSRALWINPSKAPVAADPADAAILTGGTPSDGSAPVDPNAPVDPALDPTGGTAADAVAEALALNDQEGLADGAQAVEDASIPGAISGGGADGAAAVEEARMLEEAPAGGEGTAAVEAARAMALEGKGLMVPGPRSPLETKAAATLTRPATRFEARETDAVAAEVAIGAALGGLLERQQGVITTRLESPKARKGTRFWAPDDALAVDTRGGDAALDVARAVNAEQWLTEVFEVLSAPVQDAVLTTSTAFVLALAEAGHLDIDADQVPALAGRLTQAVTMQVLARAVTAMSLWLDDLTEQVAAAETAAASIEDVVAEVREHYAHRSGGLTGQLAVNLATSALNGGAEAVASTLGGDDVDRTWRTRLDASVRPSHQGVEGVTRAVGDPFVVGAELLMYPQDPTGSPGETRGCRCRLAYRVAPGASLTAPYESLES